MQPIGAHGSEVMYFGSFCFRGKLGFLNCGDICMCAVNQFEILKFVFNLVYVDLKYNEMYLLFLLLGLGTWVVCVVMWSFLDCLCGCLGTI